MLTLRRQRRPIKMQIGDAELIKVGSDVTEKRDLYTLAVSMGWPAFILLLAGAYLLMNAFFATLYLLAPGSIANARPGHFWDAFFFSVQTISTVGYGAMSPASFAGHAIATLESLCGLIFAAVMTGLIFVRFSRPQSNIIFADHMVVSQHNGLPTLMVRLANSHENVIANCTAKLTLLKRMTSREGRTYRHAYELRLHRSHLPLFLMTWTLMHEINENSPFHGITAENAKDMGILLICMVEAHDHTVGTQIFEYHAYTGDNILFDMAYQDLIFYDHLGRTHADLSKLSAVEPDVVRAKVQREYQGLA